MVEAISACHSLNKVSSRAQMISKWALILAALFVLIACSSPTTFISKADNSTQTENSSSRLQFIQVKGTQWLRADGSPIQLKGANLGNWLMMEFWMAGQRSKEVDDQCTLEATFDKRFGHAERERLMKLFRDNWITQRDWDALPRFGLNLVRLPFIWSLIEDEKNPRQLRKDAWHYIDDAINQAEARGMYVVLDMHGVPGSQGLEHHSGCAGKNLYWTTKVYQERTIWLWEQIAARYKDRIAVAGYSLVNEPWGASEEKMAELMKQLYQRVRAVDPHHVIILPGHNSGINAYGKPSEQGMKNVAFEMHFYPGHFGWSKAGVDVHRNWLQCKPNGGGTCEWDARMKRLDAPLFVGEFQPWADMDGELGGQITRASFDRYAALGWASAVWSYKVVSNAGGEQQSNWGLVANASNSPSPQIDFQKASLQDIEALFRSYGSMPYVERTEVMKWIRSKEAPNPFK